MIDDARKLATMVRHVRARKLYHRARLMGLRRWEARNPHAHQQRLRRRIGTPRLKPTLAVPAIPLRGTPVELTNGALHFDAYGTARALPLPVDWTVDASDPSTASWRMELHQQLYLDQLSTPDIVALVPHWIDNNPPYTEGAWRDAWNSNAVSIRIVTWLDVLARRTDLPEAVRARMTHSMVEQLLYLEDHLERDIGGNHFLRNVRALLWGGACIESEHSARWTSRGQDFLIAELAEQFVPDGTHYERSATYHLLGTMDIITCWQVLEPGTVRSQVTARVDTLVQVLRDLTHPDGAVCQFNDGSMTTSVTSEEVCSAWERLRGQPTAPRTTFDLPDAGYTGLRAGLDYIVVDCGRIAPDDLPGHGHGDCLAFEWSVGSQRVFVDTGVFQYVAGPARERSRSTAAHNTVTVDDADQCEFFGAFRVGRRLNITRRVVQLSHASFHLSGAHDGFSHLLGAPVHRRDLTAREGCLAIDDVIDGGDGQPATARLLVHPDAAVSITDDGAVVSVGGHTITVHASAPIRAVPAPWYPEFGEQHETIQLVIEYGPAPARGWIRLTRES